MLCDIAHPGCRSKGERKDTSFNETPRFLRDVSGGWESGTHSCWVIRLAGTKELLGSIGVRHKEHRVDLGYCLARDAWGQGFATEAARAVVDAVLCEAGVWRVSALCHVDNRASARVLEKAGMKFEGTLRRYYVFPNLSAEPLDVHCYAKVRED